MFDAIKWIRESREIIETLDREIIELDARAEISALVAHDLPNVKTKGGRRAA